MVAMTIAMPDPEMQAAAFALGCVVTLCGLVAVGAGWLFLKLSARLKRFVGGLGLALLLATTVASQLTTHLVINGLDCCEWYFTFFGLCISPAFGWCA